MVQRPTALIHDQAEDWPIYFRGAISNHDTSPIVRQLSPIIYQEDQSSASLEGVCKIQMFYKKNAQNGSNCTGMLLFYSNATQRVLGEVRMGPDPITEYVNPVYLCIFHEPYAWTFFSCTTEQSIHYHDGDVNGWTWCSMTGILEWKDAGRWIYLTHELI